MMRLKLIPFIARLLAVSVALPILLCQLVFAQENSPVVDDSFGVELVAENLPKSWSINLSPNNDMLVTDRSGHILVFDQQWQMQKYQTPISDLYEGGQGGFLDIEFHPEFESNGWIYLSYSSGTSDDNRLKVVRFKIPKIGNMISKMEEVFTLNSGKSTPVHYGGRMAFLPDNSLLISTGDGFDYREQAQIKSSHLGKILRMSDTGKALPDNPFFVQEQAESNGSYIFSLGHRNPQALLVTEEGTIISHEHGPAGGDEINFIQKGANYGWPIITNGLDYSGAVITPFTEYEGMRQANFDWTPSIAPSGMILYKYSTLDSLSQHLVVTSLKFKQLRVISLNGKTLSNERILLQDFEFRLRDIEQDRLGNILLLTDGDGKLENSTRIYKLIKK